MRGKSLALVWFGITLILLNGACRLAERQAAASIPNTGRRAVTLSPAEACRANGVSADALELGGRLYGSYCAGCHGREGQGYPNSAFPPLADSRMALSNNIQPDVNTMMNTDIHPMATRLFEADALKIINYIRVTFAVNNSFICPGDVQVRINP